MEMNERQLHAIAWRDFINMIIDQQISGTNKCILYDSFM